MVLKMAILYIGGTFEYNNLFNSDYSVSPSMNNMGMPIGVITNKNETTDFINFGINAGGLINIGDIQSLSISTFYNQDTSPIRKLELLNDILYQEFIGSVVYKIFPLDNLDINISSGVDYWYQDYNVEHIPYYIDGNPIKEKNIYKNSYISSASEIFAAWYINDMFTLKAGYNLDIQYMDINVIGVSKNNYNQIGNALFVGGDADIDTSIDFDIDMTLGVRYQATTSEGTSYDGNINPAHSFSPEFGIVLKPIVEWLVIKANVGHSFNSPTLEQLFAQAEPTLFYGEYYQSNPDLKPESAWSYSGTLEFYPIESLIISAAIFRSDANNLIEYIEDGIHSGATLRRYKNIGKAVIWGYDIGSSLSIEVGSAGMFGYGFNFEQLWATDTTQKIKLENGDKIYQRLDRPEYTISANINWMHPYWGTVIRLSGNYYAPGYTYQPNYDMTTGNIISYKEMRTENIYTTLNLRLSQDILAFVKDAPKLIMWFEIKNLLNSQIDSYDYATGSSDGDNDQEGINFKLGFDATF